MSLSESVRACCDKAAQTAMGLAAVAAQAAGIHVDEASWRTKLARRAVCLACDQLTPRPRAGRIDKHSRCKKCKCVVVWKTSLASQKCPEGLWFAEGPTSPTTGDQR